MSLPSGSLDLGAGATCVVFVPGFLTRPGAYRSLLGPLAAADVRVVVPLLHAPGPAVLLGRVTPDDDAARLVVLAGRLRAQHDAVWLAGHSRGGMVAWTAAATVEANGLALVDPVAGGGPPWTAPPALSPHRGDHPVVVIGLGDGGRCAPPDRGHRVFAAAAPGCTYVVLPGAGHADVLDGPQGRLGGALCGPGTDPAATTRAATHLLRSAIAPDAA